MTNKENKLFSSNEIIGAILTYSMSSTDISSFERSPSSFIHSAANTDVGDISLSVVENDSGVIHLALPYYSELSSNSANSLDDASMSSVAGGEIFVSLFIACVAVSVGGAVTAGISVGTAVGAQAYRGKEIDGSDK